MKRVLAVVAAGVLALAGCTSDKPKPTPGTTSTVVSTVTNTRDTGTNYKPPAASYVKPLPPGKKPPKGERERLCPYIRTGLDQDPTSKPNVADAQGNRIYRTTVLTDLKPVGCRFYFYSAPFEAVAEIAPRTFSSALEARNAMIRTAQAGTDVASAPGFVKGVDGIRFRTKFFSANKKRDWAFVFAKGRIMVVVRTEETTTSQDAINVAEAIAAKF